MVFNPVSFAREDLVQAKIDTKAPHPAFVQVFDPEEKEVPAQINENSEILFLAKMSALSYAVYTVKYSKYAENISASLSVNTNKLENSNYIVSLDMNGDVSSVYDKLVGRELLASPIRLALLEDSPQEWPAWNIDFDDWHREPASYVQGPAQIRVLETGPARVAL